MTSVLISDPLERLQSIERASSLEAERDAAVAACAASAEPSTGIQVAAAMSEQVIDYQAIIKQKNEEIGDLRHSLQDVEGVLINEVETFRNAKQREFDEMVSTKDMTISHLTLQLESKTPPPPPIINTTVIAAPSTCEQHNHLGQIRDLQQQVGALKTRVVELSSNEQLIESARNNVQRAQHALAGVTTRCQEQEQQIQVLATTIEQQRQELEQARQVQSQQAGPAEIDELQKENEVLRGQVTYLDAVAKRQSQEIANQKDVEGASTMHIVNHALAQQNQALDERDKAIAERDEARMKASALQNQLKAFRSTSGQSGSLVGSVGVAGPSTAPGMEVAQNEQPKVVRPLPKRVAKQVASQVCGAYSVSCIHSDILPSSSKTPCPK